MSYSFRVLYDNPLGCWNFDSSLATLPDLSGNGLDAIAAPRTNLISNPSFETNMNGWEGVNKNLLTVNQATLETDTTGWNGTGNATIARTTSAFKSGSASLSMTAQSTGTMYAATLTGGAGNIAIVPGQVYTAVAHFKAATQARNVAVGIEFRAADGTTILRSTTGAGKADNSVGWTQVKVSLQAPSTAKYANVVVQVTSPASGEVHYVDEIGFFWDGGANLFSDNAEFDESTANYFGANSATFAYSNTQYYIGRSSCLVTLPTNTAAQVGIGHNSMPVNAGITYTFSVWAYLPSGSVASLRLSVQGSGFTTTESAGMSTTNAWTRMSVTFTPTVDTSVICYVLNHVGSTAGQTFYVDAYSLTVGSTLMNYVPAKTTNLFVVPSGTTNTGTVAATLSSSTPLTGTLGHRATATASSSSFGTYYGTSNSFRIDVIPNQVYTFSAWLKTVSGTLNVAAVGLEWHSIGGTIVSMSSASGTVTTTWTQFSKTAAAPATASYVVIIVYLTSTGVGVAFDVSGIQVELGNVAAPYTEGGLGPAYNWASTENFLTTANQSEFATAISGWASNNSTTQSTLTRVTGESGPPVTTALEVSLGATSNTWCVLTGPAIGTQIISGETYSVSFWAKSVSGQTSWNVMFASSDALNQVGFSKAFTVTTAWQKFTATFRATANGASTTAWYINPSSATAAFDIKFTAFQVEAKMNPTPYAATGVANSSVSQRQFHWVTGQAYVDTIQRQTSGGYSGSAWAMVNNNALYYNWPSATLSVGVETVVSVLPSTTYTLSNYTMYAGGFYNKVVDNVTGSILANTAVTRYDGVWGRNSVTFTTSATTTSVRIQYISRLENPGIAETGYLDAVLLERRSTASPTYYDTTQTALPPLCEPIVALGLGALRLSLEEVIQIPISNLMASSYERRGFAFEAWVKPQSSTDYGWLFRRNNGGVKISNGKIEFILPMASTITVSWSGLIVGNVYHVVAVYDTSSAYLYVNGTLVAQQDISTADLAYGFPTETNANLTIETYNTFAMVVDAPAVYNMPVVSSQVSAHYGYGTNHNYALDASGAMGGNIFETYDGWCDKAFEWVVDTASEWNSGTLSGNTLVSGDTLQTFWTTSANYGAGSWTGAFTVDAEATTTVGSRISWVANKYATDYIVEASLDGTSWTTVTNGSQPFGATNLVAGQTFYVRVTFSAATTVTTITKLRVAIYRSKGVKCSNHYGLALTLGNEANIGIGDTQTNAATFGDNAGYLLAGSTSKLTVPQDTVFGGYRTVEFFARWDTTQASKTILSTADGAAVATDSNGAWTWSGGASVYVDGVILSGTPTPSPGIWHHVVVLLPITTAGIVIGNNAGASAGFVMRVNHIVAFFNTLTATQISSLYTAAVGYVPVRTIDGSVSTLTEHVYSGSGNAYLLYTYNWSVSGAG